MANIAEIKTKLGVESLGLSYLRDDKGERAVDETTKKPTQWLRHWDNDNRVAVVVHEETLAKIKATPDMSNLALKWSTKQPADATKAPYQMAVIIAHTPADETL